MRRPRSAPLRGLLWFCILCAGALSCRPPAPLASTERLWTGREDWVQVQDGWVQGISLADGVVLSADLSDAARRFRALAWSSGTASLSIEQGGQSRTLPVHGPTPLDISLAAVALHEGIQLQANGEVVLLWPRLVDPRRQGRRWVLAVADTLRFDHADADLMPRLHGYFAEGRRYHRAFSAASWTLPSMAALFTGKSTSRLRHPDGALITIPPEHPTLASELRESGFATVGVTANYTINHENGFSAGFDTFLAPVPEGTSGDFRDATWVAEWARRMAAWAGDLDLFLYLQFMDPHDPYRHHETGEAWDAPQTGHQPAPGEVDTLRQAYASEVRYLDRHLAPLLEELSPQRVVFTSDHGEEFFDHGGFRHGPALYPESVHVPLWVRGEGIEPGDLHHPVSLVDLFRFWQGDVAALDTAPSPVVMETYSHGPPRWSTVERQDGAQEGSLSQWILFADRVESEAVPGDATTVGQWLQEHHPPLQRLDWDNETGGPGGKRLPQHLVDHFNGFRRGVFVHLPSAGSHLLALGGLEGSGWLWGEGEADLQPQGEGWLLDVQSEEPFALVFMPVGNDVEPTVESSSGQALSLDEAVELDGGVRIWLDSGRPPDSLRSTTETLERLKALGYI